MTKYQVIMHNHIFKQDTFFNECHASTLLRLANGDILCAWFAGTHEKHDDVAIWISKLSNGAWSNPYPVADEKNIPCWNPVLFSDKRGKITLFYKVGKQIPIWKTMFIESVDNGINWSTPKELIAGDTGARGPVKNKAIILKTGTILAPASVETETHWDCFVDISKDHGAHWQKSNFVPIDHSKLKGKGVIQPTLWQDENDLIHMFMRSSEGFIFKSHSHDEGLTWSTATATHLPNNNSGIDVVLMEKGKLVLVYNPISGDWAARSPICFSVSDDNGISFSEANVLDHTLAFNERAEGEFSYPAIISCGNRIYISYTWKRKMIAYWEIEIF